MAKNKTCFVIMPISDAQNYPVGHFKRVYEHLIKPACEKAGFDPVRADDEKKTNVIILDILQKIIEADICLCDLSSKNPNVMYELGIRQAFNLPVTIIKDTKTDRIFDLQTLRDIEYDDNLRIDNVKQKIEEISETLKNTVDDQAKGVNSLIKLLQIQPAKLTKELKVSEETSLILERLDSMNDKINSLEEKMTEETYYPLGSSLADKLYGNGRSQLSELLEKYNRRKTLGATGSTAPTVSFGDNDEKQ